MTPKTNNDRSGTSGLTESQKNAVNLRDTDLLVSAGAGTGKTRVLVSRFIRLVLDGETGVDEILTVTFTEKAADEMKRRIADEFRKLDMHEEKRAVENAFISTIHGFCARVLRENPFAAGIDPEFRVMSEIDQAVIMNRAYLAVLETADESMMDLIDRFEDKNVRAALRDYIELNRSLGRSMGRIAEIIKNPDTLIDVLLKKLESYILDLQARLINMAKTLRGVSTDGKVEEYRAKVLDYIETINTKIPDSRTLNEISGLLFNARLKNSRRKDDYDFKLVSETLFNIKKFLEKNMPFFKVDMEDQRRDIDESLIPFLRAAELFWKKYDEIKRDEGLLDYEDLQLLTRDMLATNEAVRHEYGSKFKHLLVDEFQDINELQKEVLELLKPKNGFFIVGDTRQSIYGFRNADVGIMRGYRSDYRNGGGECVELNENFRANDNILKFINHFFSSLWENREENQPLIHARDEYGHESKAPNVELILFSEDVLETKDGKASLDDIRAYEAQAVAARVNELVQNGYMIHDRYAREFRQVKYSDIAVLVHTRATYRFYSGAFNRQGIPFSMHQSMDFFEQREVKDVIAFISVIDNSRRDIDVAAVLRSPFYEISDDALVYIRKFAERNGIKGPYLTQSLKGIINENILDENDRRKVGDFLSLLEDLRETKDLVPLTELFDMMMEQTQYEARTLTLWGGERKIANLMKMRELMHIYRNEPRGGVSGFIKFYNDVKNWGLREEEAEQETEEENKVKFITVHGAKGLEFPVVIIADLARQYRSDKKKIMVSRDLEAGFPDARGKNTDTIRKQLIIACEKGRAIEEKERLLYVAMTRARDYLILAGSSKESSRGSSPLDMVNQHLISKINLEDRCDSVEISDGGSKILASKNAEREINNVRKPRLFIDTVMDLITDGKKIPKTLIEGYDHNTEKTVRKAVEFVRRVGKMEVPRIPDHLAVTDLMLFKECPRKYYLLRVLNLPNADLTRSRFVDKRGKGELHGVELGKIVHESLEQIDYAKEPEAEIERVVKSLRLASTDETGVSNLLKKFLHSRLADEIRKAEELLREVPLTLYVSDIPIHGRIDLLYRAEDGSWRFVDYKTDKIETGDIGDKAEHYRLQMHLYGLTLSKLQNIIPKDGIAYFLVPNEKISFRFTPDVLDECSRQVEEIIDKIKTGGFEPAREEFCKTCEYHKLYCRHFPGAE